MRGHPGFRPGKAAGRLPELGPPFAPVTREAGGLVAEFSRREAPEVDLEPSVHLMCVNFRTMRNAVYAYAGGPEVRGTRHMGCAHLVAAGHRVRAHTPDPTDHVVLRLDPARLREEAAAGWGTDEVELRTDGLPFFDPEIFRLAHAARDELRAGNPGGPLAIGSLGARLGEHLLRHHARLPGRRRPERLAIGPAKLARVEAYVEDNIGGRVTLDDLAAVAGLSPAHLVRVFRAATGRTPHQYVLDRRVAAVRERLFEPGGADLAALAARAGFAHHSHMTQCFRARVGLTPSEFRAAVR